ncbi:transposase (plasmid) [Burkholderia sp. M6-3]
MISLATDCGFSEEGEFFCEPHRDWHAGLARTERLKSRLCGCENGCKSWPAGDSHEMTVEQFEQFILPHLGRGRRGPPPTLPLQKMFNYVLKALYMGCRWKMLPIETDAQGLPEIHHVHFYRIIRRWQADGSIERVVVGSADQLHQDQRLDLSTIHGDGTTTAAKKGGGNLGYSGHKHLKGDKVVAFCDRNFAASGPTFSATANRTNAAASVI